MNTSWSSPEGLTAICVIFTTFGGIIAAIFGWFLHTKDESQKKDIKRLSDSLDKAWEKIDKLNDEKHGYLTRDDHDGLREEIRADIAQLGAQMEKNLNAAVTFLTTLINTLRSPETKT